MQQIQGAPTQLHAGARQQSPVVYLWAEAVQQQKADPTEHQRGAVTNSDEGVADR